VLHNIGQNNFNQIEGLVHELNDSEDFPSITLEVGRNTKRYVNLVSRKSYFDEIHEMIKVGTRVVVTYFLSSRYKYGRWYTMANVLKIDLA
jgi:hypothetical protein